MSDANLARNVHDVLTAISPAPPGAGDLSEPDLALNAQEVPVLASWCGAAEAGNATAAGDSGEGARRRRKRRRQEGVAEVSGIKVVGSEAGGKRGVRWASQALRRRAWSGAWLALLRMPLPDDVFRKVRSATCLCCVMTFFNIHITKILGTRKSNDDLLFGPLQGNQHGQPALPSALFGLEVQTAASSCWAALALMCCCGLTAGAGALAYRRAAPPRQPAAAHQLSDGCP